MSYFQRHTDISHQSWLDHSCLFERRDQGILHSDIVTVFVRRDANGLGSDTAQGAGFDLPRECDTSVLKSPKR